MVYLCLSLIHCIILSLLFPHRLFLTIKSDAKHCHNIGYFGMPFLKPRCGQFYIIFNRTLCANTNAHTEPFPLQSIEICLGCTKVQVQCGNEHLLSRDNPYLPPRKWLMNSLGVLHRHGGTFQSLSLYFHTGMYIINIMQQHTHFLLLNRQSISIITSSLNTGTDIYMIYDVWELQFVFKLGPFPSYCSVSYSNSLKAPQMYLLTPSSTTLRSSFSYPGITFYPCALCQGSRHNPLRAAVEKLLLLKRQFWVGRACASSHLHFQLCSPGQNAVPLQFQSKWGREFMAKLNA